MSKTKEKLYEIIFEADTPGGNCFACSDFDQCGFGYA